MITVLGVGGSEHDVNACIVRDGRVAIAIEEERISRKKYGIGGNLLDGLARRYCLEALDMRLSDFDHVVADSILAPTALLGVRKRAVSVDHHLAHAACAWFTSGFDSAAVIVADNAGDLVANNGGRSLQATSWYSAAGRDIHLLGRVGSANWKQGAIVRGQPYERGDGDHSLGHFYKKATGALGYRYPFDAALDGYYFPEDGITMGLASYGDLRFLGELCQLIELEPEGSYKIWLNDGRLDAMLARWLEGGADFQTRASVAAAFQEALTRVLCHVVEYVMRLTGESDLCLAGGVAMNSVANGEILRRTRVGRLYVPPVPGDNGTGAGAAFWTAARNIDEPLPAYSVYGGRCYSSAEVDESLRGLDHARYRQLHLGGCALIEEAAARIAAGQVLAWFDGGAESGRRALGHRSILADPRRAEMRDHLNQRVKKRQPFRPFAPVVAEHRVSEFFEAGQASPYMQIVFPVRPERRDHLAAITHVDGSARVQTVREDQNPRLSYLLTCFEKISGIPVILNTSLNGRGEPIAETPADAVRALDTMPLDGLVFEDRLVARV
jgi:carbamoyltransferase